MQVRGDNVGWIMNTFKAKSLMNVILDCVIINLLTGSDHCPIGSYL